MRHLFFNIPQLAAIFSGNSVARQIILLLKFWYFSITRKLWMRDNKLAFKLSYREKELNIFLWNNTDLTALIEIYILNEYSCDLSKDPEIIVDLGAHTGNTALYFHSLYPEAKIYAVEASPVSFERLKLNVSGIKNITPVFGAVSDSDGEIEFFESESSLGSSLNRRSDSDSSVVVSTFTLRTLLSMHNIEKADFIKVDIEGAEELLFTEDPQDYSRAYIIEVHGDLMRMQTETFYTRFSNMNMFSTRISNHRSLMKAFEK